MNKLFVTSVITALLLSNVSTAHAAQITVQEAITASTTNLNVEFSPSLSEPIATATPTLTQVTVGTALAQTKVETKPKTVQETAHEMVSARFGAAAIASFDAIVMHESSWNLNAVNASSGACGLGQALPCTKIADHSATGQITWMIDYIAQRYGNPIHAWNFWQAHHWY